MSFLKKGDKSLGKLQERIVHSALLKHLLSYGAISF